MITITLVIPYLGFIQNAVQIFEEHNKFGEFYDLESNYKFQLIEQEVNQEDLPHFIPESDVIISRGVTAQVLKTNQNYIPIVDIPVSGNDLIKAVHLAIKTYGSKKIAVIGSQNMIYGVEGLSEVFNVSVKAFIMNSMDYSESLVDTALYEGFDTIIGGAKACKYAFSKGANSLFIETSKESFWQAITEAKRLAILHRKEEEKLLRLKTMLEATHEGVVSVDNEEIVTIFNESAKKIFTLPLEAEVVGSRADEVEPLQAIKHLFTAERDKEEEVIRIGEYYYLVTARDVYLRAGKIGKILNLKDVGKIQNQENFIRQKVYLKGHIAKYHFADITYKSKVMGETIAIAEKYSKTNSNILIQGESGTGKEMMAQSIHNCSYRHSGPFIAINCAALNESLLESTLFGYVEGAFTGAIKGGKKGLFELAHEGTIFLDEIGEMPLDLQGKLLRVLQEKEVMRLGDDRIIPIDVRIIAATNRDLYELTDARKFREDLFYRLNVLNIHIPSFDRRREDIPVLITKFISDFCKEYHKTVTIQNEALQLLTSLRWKGNIREMKNISERLVVLCDRTITEDDVLRLVVPENMMADRTHNGEGEGYDFRKKVNEALVANANNKTKTAEELGISRTTLWRYLNETK